jgi:hypothetical protein
VIPGAACWSWRRSALLVISRHEGWRVLVSAVGRSEDALGWPQQQPDLITLDIYLPDTDGFSCCELSPTGPDIQSPLSVLEQAGFAIGRRGLFDQPIDERLLFRHRGTCAVWEGSVLVVDDRDTLELCARRSRPGPPGAHHRRWPAGAQRPAWNSPI